MYLALSFLAGVGVGALGFWAFTIYAMKEIEVIFDEAQKIASGTTLTSSPKDGTQNVAGCGSQ